MKTKGQPEEKGSKKEGQGPGSEHHRKQRRKGHVMIALSLCTALIAFMIYTKEPDSICSFCENRYHRVKDIDAWVDPKTSDLISLPNAECLITDANIIIDTNGQNNADSKSSNVSVGRVSVDYVAFTNGTVLTRARGDQEDLVDDDEIKNNRGFLNLGPAHGPIPFGLTSISESGSTKLFVFDSSRKSIVRIVVPANNSGTKSERKNINGDQQIENERTVLFEANDPRFIQMGRAKSELRWVSDLVYDPLSELLYFADFAPRDQPHQAFLCGCEPADLDESGKDEDDGRLFVLDLKSGDLRLLVDNLFAPTSLALEPKQEGDDAKSSVTILVNEFQMARILKFTFASNIMDKAGFQEPQTQKAEIFTELPGYAQSIRVIENTKKIKGSSLLVSFAAVTLPRKDESPIPNSFSSVANKWWLWLLSRFSVFRAILGYVRTPQEILDMLDGYGLLAELDLSPILEKGRTSRVIRTWHDTKGSRISRLTTADILTQGPRKTVFMSSLNNCCSVARFELKN